MASEILYVVRVNPAAGRAGYLTAAAGGCSALASRARTATFYGAAELGDARADGAAFAAARGGSFEVQVYQG